MILRYHLFETALGFCTFGWNSIGVVRFQLPSPTAAAAESIFLRRGFVGELCTPPKHLSDVVELTRRYFASEKTDFSTFPIDLTNQSPLFKRIYAAARSLSWGETTTYGDIARSLNEGREVARDVGQAMAKNPVPLLIPCHRVLAAGGRLGGFSAPGGVNTKLKLLELEGIRIGSHDEGQGMLSL